MMTIDLGLNHLLPFPIQIISNVAKIANRLCFRTFRAFHKALLNDSKEPLLSIENRTIQHLQPIENTDKKVRSIFFPSTKPSEKSLSPIETRDLNPNASLVLWQKNFEHVIENQELIQDPFNAWLEKFVKVVINYTINANELIPVPTKTGAIEYYKIHRKIVNNGLLAFALIPAEKGSSLSPLIVFRATEINIFAEEGENSMQNDLDPHLGEPGWKASEKDFEDLMKDPTFKEKSEQVKVAGYSLGGVHAQYYILHHMDHVSHAIFYNNPSAESKVAEAFAEKIQNSSRETPLVMQIFRTIGDPFPHFGEKHIGCKVNHPNLKTQLFEVEYPNQSVFDVTLHSRRIFDTSRFDYKITEYTDPESLNLLLDNSQRDPITTSLEKLRKLLGKGLSLALKGITTLVFFVLYLIGLKINRTYDREYVIRY